MSDKFFFEHAGWSWDPKTQTPDEGRIESAARLSNAEKWALDNDVRFEWHPDEDRGMHVCIAILDNERSAALGGIDINANHTYARVIEAELALELQMEAAKSDKLD